MGSYVVADISHDSRRQRRKAESASRRQLGYQSDGETSRQVSRERERSAERATVLPARFSTESLLFRRHGLLY